MIYSAKDILCRLDDDCKKEQSKPKFSTEDEFMDAFLWNRLDSDTLASAYKDLRLKLGEHMRLDHVLFLFGNGASLYAGSKETKDFKLDKYINNSSFADIKQDLEKISKLGGIEAQLNALITVRSYFNLINYADNEKIVSELIDMIKKELIESFVNSVDYRKLQLHKIMLLKLRALGVLPKTQIYTTNYDLAFEYAMDSLSIEYTDGFSGFVNRQFNPRTFAEGGKPSLVKIHGSVNWVYKDRRIKEVQPEFSDGRLNVGETAPVLIYPTSNKLHETYSTPYSELMRHMLDVMESGSNVVVVMGYKYGDEHINEILYKALENPRNIFYFFVFENPSSSGFINDVSALADSMPNINILSGPALARFDIFVKYILPAAIELTDEEKALVMLHRVLSKNE